MLYISEPGKIRLFYCDAYTGIRGYKDIPCDLGLEIDGLYVDYLTSGQELILTAVRMPDGIEEDVTWSLRDQDKTYAALSSEYGKSTVLTAKVVDRAVQIQLTATPNDPVDAPEVRTLWILPAVKTVTIADANTGEVLAQTDTKAQTVKVDMYTANVLRLSASASPEDASDEFFWGSSNCDVVDVNYDGVLTLKQPGTVAITANSSDGSGVTASFKLEVYYLDTAKKLTAATAKVSQVKITVKSCK